MKPSLIPSISCADALSLVTKAAQIATEQNLTICAAVIDGHGRSKAFVSMDGVPVIADKLVFKKANTALMSLPSNAFFDAISESPDKLHSFANLDDLTFLAGGLPLVYDRTIVGAFAVAGALPEKDLDIALEALAAIKGEEGV